MNEQQIRALVQQEIQAYTSGKRFGLSTIPRHIHNGQDSPQIGQQNIVPQVRNSGNVIMTQATDYTFRKNSPNTTSVWFYGAATKTLYTFTISSGNATAGAVYTTGGYSFTVTTTVSGATSVTMWGANYFGSSSNPGKISTSGTLTKSSGTGDSTLTYSNFSEAIQIRVHCVGNAQLGASYYLQPDTTTSVQFGGPQQNVIQSSTMFLADSSTSPTTIRALSDEGHIVDVEYSGVVVRATVSAYDINTITVTVSTIVAGWELDGNWILT